MLAARAHRSSSRSANLGGLRLPTSRSIERRVTPIDTDSWRQHEEALADRSPDRALCNTERYCKTLPDDAGAELGADVMVAVAGERMLHCCTRPVDDLSAAQLARATAPLARAAAISRPRAHGPRNDGARVQRRMGHKGRTKRAHFGMASTQNDSPSNAKQMISLSGCAALKERAVAKASGSLQRARGVG